MTTLTEGQDNFSNRETYETYQWITKHGGTPTLVERLCSGSKNIGEFADKLEQLLWLIWEGKIQGRDSLKPVDWVQIANRWLDAHSLDADTFFQDNPN